MIVFLTRKWPGLITTPQCKLPHLQIGFRLVHPTSSYRLQELVKSSYIPIFNLYIYIRTHTYVINYTYIIHMCVYIYISTICIQPSPSPPSIPFKGSGHPPFSRSTLRRTFSAAWPRGTEARAKAPEAAKLLGALSFSSSSPPGGILRKLREGFLRGWSDHFLGGPRFFGIFWPLMCGF